VLVSSNRFLAFALLGLALSLAGCGEDVFILVENGKLTVRISVNTDNLVLLIGGEAESVEVSLVRTGETGPVNLSLDGVPAGVSVEIEHPGILSRGRVTFQAGAEAAPQSDIRVTIMASDGAIFDSTELILNTVR
jgi:hypothetical protein